MDFIPLHIYSGFSYLHSGLVASRIPLIAKKKGYQAIGLSDIGTLSGFAPFTHASFSAKIKPLYLMDLPLDEGVFSLFVKDEEGYRNLLFLTLRYSEKKVSLEDLKSHQKGLTIIYGAENPVFEDSYRSQDENGLAGKLQAILGSFPDVYIGLPYYPSRKDFLSFLRHFLLTHPYKFVAFPHIAYEKKGDAIVTKITEAIFEKATLSTKFLDGDEYFVSEEDIKNYYSNYEIKETEIISASSSFDFIVKRGTLLHYEDTGGLSSIDFLKQEAIKGLEKKVPEASSSYLERLNYELGIIHSMGYDDYFLVVADYVRFAKSHDIYVGPGRGSGPASLVAYSLDISSIDPVKYDLVFERFLNPERKSLPDIDVDFSDVHRDEVATYLQNKYGKERVGHVLTTQTIGAKEALHDIGRVYGYQDREIGLILGTIINDHLSLRDDYRQSPPFKKLVDSDPYYLEIVSLASKIEGLPRQAGLHAAGIILNNESLPNVMPTKDEEGIGYVGCLEKDYLEEQGFLKMDLLGLRNLSIIETCLDLIEEKTGKKLDKYNLPYDDPKAIETIKEGRTMGLFQLESPGMKRAIAEVAPSSYEDVAALLALFRPGPMESIPSFARRKKGLEKVSYLSPELEPILKGTYGVIVYQEQIMQIVQAVAGFSLGEADLFRRAISHKDSEKLASYRGKFLLGCKNKGKDEALAKNLFDLIYRFANYGFNKAHAYSYAMLTDEMSYLKTYYPLEFYCSILDFLSPSDVKFKDTLKEMRELGLSLAVPSINKSNKGYALEGEKIILPLSIIKGFPVTLSSSIIDERSLNGPYKDIYDLAYREKKDGLSLTNFIKLIDSGALDEFGGRASLRASAPGAISYAEMLGGEEGNEALLSLGIEKPALQVRDESKRADLEGEYEVLGIMVSGSPLSFYKEEIKKAGAYSLSEIDNAPHNFVVAGIIKSIRAIVTKKGTKMCFLEVYDELSDATFILWSEAYLSSFKSLVEEAPVLIEGYKDDRGGYIASKVTVLGEDKQ